MQPIGVHLNLPHPQPAATVPQAERHCERNETRKAFPVRKMRTRAFYTIQWWMRAAFTSSPGTLMKIRVTLGSYLFSTAVAESQLV